MSPSGPDAVVAEKVPGVDRGSLSRTSSIGPSLSQLHRPDRGPLAAPQAASLPAVAYHCARLVSAAPLYSSHTRNSVAGRVILELLGGSHLRKRPLAGEDLLILRVVVQHVGANLAYAGTHR